MPSLALGLTMPTHPPDVIHLALLLPTCPRQIGSADAPKHLHSEETQHMHTAKKVALVVGAQGLLEAISPPIFSCMADGMSPGFRADHRGKAVCATSQSIYWMLPTAGISAELAEPNVRMLRKVVENIEPVAMGLEHISLMQGYKVYGAHLGPFQTPAKESDAPHIPPEFNVDQQDYLERRQEGKRWTWSALRPAVVCGFSLGRPMNLAMVIAICASISKELGVPLRTPGKPGAYNTLMELTDASVLAKATVWAATDPRCGNQAFNINNGDLFRWKAMWLRIAKMFDLDTAPPLQMNLTSVMADKEAVWEKNYQKARSCRHAVQRRVILGFRRFRFFFGLRLLPGWFQSTPIRFSRIRRYRAYF